jgi:GDP-D-mannose dehydratase
MGLGRDREYVRGVWLILKDVSEDYALTNDKMATVSTQVERAFEEEDVTLRKECAADGGVFLRDQPIPDGGNRRNFRSTEVDLLISDPTKAKADLQLLL